MAMERQFIHFRDTGRVIAFDPLVLGRSRNYEVVGEAEAKRLNKKVSDDRKRTRAQREEDELKAAAKAAGIQLTGRKYEGDAERKDREKRESARSIRAAGDGVTPADDQNINNDPDMPGGVGYQHQADATQDDLATGVNANEKPEGVQAEGATHKEAFLKDQHAADMSLAERIARVTQQPEGVGTEPANEPSEEGTGKGLKRATPKGK